MLRLHSDMKSRRRADRKLEQWYIVDETMTQHSAVRQAWHLAVFTRLRVLQGMQKKKMLFSFKEKKHSSSES